MGATKARCGLLGLGILLLGSLVVVDAVWARGEVSFIARRDFGVGAGPFSVTVGDFNGDGRQDLATANEFASTVSILLGRGDGTFQAAPDVGVGTGPRSVAVGDFNGDGRPDLATANPDASTVSILLNNTPGVVVNDFVTFEPIRPPSPLRPIPPGVPQALWASFASRRG